MRDGCSKVGRAVPSPRMMRTAVSVFALLVRIVAIERSGATTIAFGDGPDYVNAAQSLCTQHAYPERGNLPFFRAPGLPFFIAGVTACEPSHTRAIKYALAICDALSVLLIFLIAQRLHESRVAAIIAALLASLNPFFVGAVTDIRSEPLFMMLLIAAIFFALRANAIPSGIALALASLVRPTGLLCIPLFALFFVPRWKRVFALIVAATLTLAPWTIRNVMRFGEPIVVNDAAGFNLWRGTHPELLRIVALKDPVAFRDASWRFETQISSDAAKIVDARAKSPGARDREWRRLAWQNVKADPSFAMKTTVQKALMYWRMWLHPAEHGPKAVIASAILLIAMFILGALGLWRYRDRRIAIAVVVFFVAMWLAHVPYIPTLRLRTPLTDPLLIVFAAAALERRLSAGRQLALRAADRPEVGEPAG